MKRNVLFLVHVEEAFRHLFPDKLYIHRLLKAIQAKRYDEVICLESQIDTNFELIQEIKNLTFMPRVINWGWGYEAEMFEGKEKAWVIPTDSCHQTTWVPPELRKMQRNLQQAKVFVGGGGENECLQDFMDVLAYLNVPAKKVGGYIF